MTEAGRKRAEQRKETDRQKAQELKRMRERLIKIIDDKNVSDTEALTAISLLWSISEKTRYY